LITVMRLSAPWPVSGNDVDQATVAAAISALAEGRRDGQRIYLSISKKAPNPKLIQDITDAVRGIRVLPIGDRPDNDGCAALASALGACKGSDFLEVDYRSMQLWHVVLIRNGTFTFNRAGVRTSIS
jgi:hypothetical protein